MGWMTDPVAEPETPVPSGTSGTTWTPPDPVAANAPTPPRPLWDTRDVAKSTGSGLALGTAGLADTILTGGKPGPGSFEVEPIPAGTNLSGYTPKIRTDAQPQLTPVGDIARKVAPEAMSYEPTSVFGGYAQTGAEFVPGMLFPAGKGGIGQRLIHNVIAPAVASETAANVAKEYFPESETAEAWSRLAGAFLGSPLAKGAELGVRVAKRPSSVDPIMATLERNRIATTAGNYARDPQLLAREAAAARTGEILSNQPQQFTDAALKLAGVQKPTAAQTLTEVIEAARKSAGQTYQKVTNGLSVMPSRLHVSRMRDIASNYATNVEGGLQTGTISAIQKGIGDAYRNGTPISPKLLGNWRSTVSAATRSASPVARQSAIETLKVLDDVIGRSLAQAGRKDDIALLGKARSQYRDILAVEGGLLKSGKLGDEGIITPDALVRSLSSQGKEAFMRGRRGELADLARAGRAGIVPVAKIPPVQPTRAGTALRVASDAAGSMLGYELGQKLFPDNPMLQYMAGGLGAGTVEAARKGAMGLSSAAIGSRPVQEALKRAAMNPASRASALTGPAAGIASGAIGVPIGEREGRKAGGRVGMPHEKAADQLVMAAERAKKGISKGTESLLDMSDNHIAHALEVANRSI